MPRGAKIGYYAPIKPPILLYDPDYLSSCGCFGVSRFHD